ncbi:MAG: sugar ABC transporter ATP-binding protein [Microbacterium sp.]|uniref:sugar ABC transporter ATP-binding protein n=1 Tax=Microbacterium sp. TaxID=51671 RepID=UPI001AC16B19|nr:sugar ABC transporter ATP-binding protein [Microbacterium sp.]MBN9177459.1 sugar ABC transporter ATP-binding protein [Microbacterium sp.]
MSTAPLTATSSLAVENLTKRYGHVSALDGVTLHVNPGEVVGIVGQNGAGKSTLLKTLAGVIQPDSGHVLIGGRPTTVRSPADAAHKGIGIVFQEQSLIDNLTVAENIFLGRRPRATRGGLYRWSALRQEAATQLAKIDSPVDPARVVGTLSFVEKQMVELAKVLSLEEHVDGHLTILLDEPTSVLSPTEIELLFAEIQRIKQRSSVVFVSHRMDEVLAVSDRIYVMSNGRCVAERDPAECDEEELYRLMVGEEKQEDYYFAGLRPHSGSEEERLVVEGLSSPHGFTDVSFSLRSGRVLGIGGVVGSGREELCRALFGARPRVRGRIRLDGEEFLPLSPRRAIARGIGFVPAERKVEGVVMGQSIARNLTYALLDRLAVAGVVRTRSEVARVSSWTARLRVKLGDPSDDIATLSGGNQQKIALAKWLCLPELKVLILDHPTRGLDLGAKADVYRTIREATVNGLAVLLLSDTLDELFGLSDDVLIMRDGTVTAEYRDVAASSPSFDDVLKNMV